MFPVYSRRVGRVPNIVPRNPPLPTIQHDAVRSRFPDSTTFQSTENSPGGMSSESESQVEISSSVAVCSQLHRT